MSQGANVDDLDVFRYTKAAVIKFRNTVDTALINADTQAARTLHWLEGEQLSHWQSQIRKRQEHVMRCREAVRAKTLFKDSSGRTPSAFQEEKALRAALLAVEEAERRLSSTKRAIPSLQKEIEAYRSGVQGLAGALVTDVPRAIALLERLSASLHDYVTLSSPTPSASSDASATSAPQSNMHRGGEAAPDTQPKRDDDKEAGHVGG